jgi:hypothetical protein
MGVWANNPEARKPYHGPGDVRIRLLPHKGKRPRSASQHRQRLMKDGMTANEFIEAVKADAERLARIDLSYDKVAGFIDLVPAAAAIKKRMAMPARSRKRKAPAGK